MPTKDISSILLNRDAWKILKTEDMHEPSPSNNFNVLHALAETLTSHQKQILNDILTDQTIDDSFLNRLINGKIKGEEYGNTPLHTMIANEEHEIALLFLKLIKQRNLILLELPDAQKKTQLILSAKTRDQALSLKLLETIPGIDINYQDCDQRTALHYACIFGMKKLILRLSDDLNVDLNLKDGQNKTAYDYLAACDNQEICITLRSVSINAKRSSNARTNEILDKNYQSLFTMENFHNLDKLKISEHQLKATHDSISHLEAILNDPNFCLLDTDSLANTGTLGRKALKAMSKKEVSSLLSRVRKLSKTSLLNQIQQDRKTINETMKVIRAKQPDKRKTSQHPLSKLFKPHQTSNHASTKSQKTMLVSKV